MRDKAEVIMSSFLQMVVARTLVVASIGSLRSCSVASAISWNATEYILVFGDLYTLVHHDHRWIKRLCCHRLARLRICKHSNDIRWPELGCFFASDTAVATTYNQTAVKTLPWRSLVQQSIQPLFHLYYPLCCMSRIFRICSV
ncbi:hypothetical protein EDD22DRAFT_559610 [Suillus occidentalis]|nr:hypothetical protein EDD22DRAFT_559610 [Suillus occidentalis]